MDLLAVLLVAILFILANSRYVYQTVKKEITPMLSTWIIFLTATSLNVCSYLVATEKDYLSGIFGIVDAISCFVVVIVIIFFAYSGINFKKFEKYYLGGAGMIVLFWIISNNAFITNLLIQALIATGYFPTIQNLIKTKKNTESFSVWGLVLLASIVSLYPAWGNSLAVIYSARSAAMVSILLILMLRVKLKEAKKA